MPRNLTDPNYDDVFEWQERVVDPDGDSLSFTVAVDGTDISNVSWASYSTTTNTVNGDETEVLLDFTADRSGLTEGQTYQFEVTADDGLATTTRTFVLEIAGILPGAQYGIIGNDEGQFNSTTYSYRTDYGTNGDITSINYSNRNTYGINGPDAFSRNGVHCYVADSNGEEIRQYELSTPWKLSSFSLINTLSVPTDFGNGAAIENGGTRLYVSAKYGPNIQVKQYNLSTPYDLSTASDTGKSLSISNSAKEITMSKDGTGLMAEASRNWYGYTLSTPYDLSTASQDGTAWTAPTIKDDGGYDAAFLPACIHNKDKQILCYAHNEIRNYEFGTKYDPQSLTLIDSFKPYNTLNGWDQGQAVSHFYGGTSNG